jgi:hypothetical protein
MSLPDFYRLAQCSQKECKVKGCSNYRVRGISVCPYHEYQWDNLAKPKQWQEFIGGKYECS